MSTFWSNFKEIHEFHIVRLISGRSVGDVVGRRFGCASPSQIDETAGSHTKKMQLSTFLKPVGENHCVKYYKHILFKDSPLSGTLSVGIEALNPEVGIKFVYATEGF